MALIARLPQLIRSAATVLTVGVLVLLVAAPAMADTSYYVRGRVTATPESFDADTTVQPRFAGTEVLIAVGQDIQSIVDRSAPGTHFRIAAGVHRNQQVTPKDGQTFTGESGAVLSGARVLPAGQFARQGGVFVLNGQTDDTTFHGLTLPGKERHSAVQDLWLDDTLADHVNRRADVDAPGEWFYDYDRNQVVMHDDPTTFGSVELGVTPFAFGGSAEDVIIEHLTITRYASRAQAGAIHGDDGRNWIVRHNTVTANHGVNVRVGPGHHVHHNLITFAGQMGIGGLDNSKGYQAQLVVEHNEIAYNHTLGYDWYWEAGATKFVDTTEMVFAHNWVHHNNGPGPWFDIDNRDALIASNLVEHNTHVGIFYEISFGATIRDNIIRHNGGEAHGDLGAGVYVSSSRDVEVFDNAIYGNRSPVLATQGPRGEGRYGTYEVVNLHVHHNDIGQHLVAPGVRVEFGDPTHYHFEAGNRFEANTYRIDADRPNFWAGSHVSLRAWQAMGQDSGATVLPTGTTPELPNPANGFQLATAYGAA